MVLEYNRLRQHTRLQFICRVMEPESLWYCSNPDISVSPPPLLFIYFFIRLNLGGVQHHPASVSLNAFKKSRVLSLVPETSLVANKKWPCTTTFLPYTVAYQKSCSWEAPADRTFLPLIQRHCLSSKLETKLPVHQYIHCGTEFYWLNLSPPRSCTITTATSTGLCLLLQMPDGSASNGDGVTKRLSVPLYSEWRTCRLQ